MKKRTIWVIAVILLVLILDQWLKVYIKTNIPLRRGFLLLGSPKAQIYFVENNGMAFGLEFGGVWGKLLLSVFRLIMVGFLGYLMSVLIKAKESIGFLICFALIIAGAVGNIIDSMVYGIIFSDAYHGTAHLLPFADWKFDQFLKGQVVDMLYFPLLETTYPSWVPKFGGRPFIFFRPIFNIADSAIFVGVTSIILFYRSFFTQSKNEEAEEISKSNEEEE